MGSPHIPGKTHWKQKERDYEREDLKHVHFFDIVSNLSSSIPLPPRKYFAIFVGGFVALNRKRCWANQSIFLFELFIALGSAANFHFLKAIWNSFARPVFRCVPDPVGCHRMIPSRSRCLESPPSDAIEGSKITPYGPMILEP